VFGNFKMMNSGNLKLSLSQLTLIPAAGRTSVFEQEGWIGYR
jgi:hypothetical protein